MGNEITKKLYIYAMREARKLPPDAKVEFEVYVEIGLAASCGGPNDEMTTGRIKTHPEFHKKEIDRCIQLRKNYGDIYTPIKGEKGSYTQDIETHKRYLAAWEEILAQIERDVCKLP